MLEREAQNINVQGSVHRSANFFDLYASQYIHTFSLQGALLLSSYSAKKDSNLLPLHFKAAALSNTPIASLPIFWQLWLYKHT